MTILATTWCIAGEYIFMDEDSKEVRYPVTFCWCSGYYQCQETFTDDRSTFFVLTDFAILDRDCALYTRIRPSKTISELLKKNLVMIVPPATSAARSIFRPLWKGKKKEQKK